GGGAVVLLGLWFLLELLLRRRAGARDEADPEAEAVGAGVGAEDVAADDSGTDGPSGPVPLVAALLLAGLVGLAVAGPLGLAAGALGAVVPSRLRAPTVLVVLAGAGVALSVLGVAERQSTGAWVSQGLGTFTLGLPGGALVRPGARGRGPARDAPPASTTGAPAPR